MNKFSSSGKDCCSKVFSAIFLYSKSSIIIIGVVIEFFIFSLSSELKGTIIYSTFFGITEISDKFLVIKIHFSLYFLISLILLNNFKNFFASTKLL